MINWEQNDWFPTGKNPGDTGWNDFWTVQGNEPGWPIPMYATFYIIGITLAVLFCWWQFHRKQISVTELALGVIIIIPCSLFGGSVFGKLNAEGLGKNAGGVGFWGLFAFWEPGMAIHGGVYVGTIVGVIVYGIMGHYTKVSLWTYMDLIIPNILLGQFVGRWGNFFNHEVMGAPIADITAGQSALSWLPHYIRVNTQVTFHATTDAPTMINGIAMVDGHVYQMAPIFFYESMALLVGWFLIVFIIPNIGKWFGPKPWKKHSDLFRLNWKQTFINVFMFWKVPSNSKMDEMTREYYKEGLAPSYDNQPQWSSSWFVIWKQAYEYNPNFTERDEYQSTINDVQKSNQSLTKKRYKMGKALRKANNPEGYWTTKVGCQACAYFVVWNIVRFALELQRPDDHLFIMFEKTLSLSLIGASVILGIVGMVLTQTIAPTFFRQPGYLYEKQYFKDKPINKHWWTTSRKLATEQMSSEGFRASKTSIKSKEVKDENKIAEKQRKAAEKLAKMEAKQKNK